MILGTNMAKLLHCFAVVHRPVVEGHQSKNMGHMLCPESAATIAACMGQTSEFYVSPAQLDC